MVVLVACSAPAREIPPQANVARAASRGSCDLDWIGASDSLRVTERTDGHEGWFEFEVALRRTGDVFTGSATASYRRYEQAPPTRGTRELHVPSSRIDAALVAMRTSFDLPPDPADAKRVVMDDSWHTVRLVVELAGAARARLTTEGQIHPQPWHLDGCDRELPHAGRARFEKAYADLELLVGRQGLFDALERQAAP
jgi:hypothetical protein